MIKIAVACMIAATALVSLSMGVTNTYARTTHMTLHDLTNLSAMIYPNVETDQRTCIAQPGSTCEVGTQYEWYTIDVWVPAEGVDRYEVQETWVYGDSNVYVLPDLENPGEYNLITSSNSAAQAAEQPQENRTTPVFPLAQ